MRLLKFKLKSLNIPLSEVEKYLLYQRSNEDGLVAYEDLQYKLTCYPFSIQDLGVVNSICNYIFDSDSSEKFERVSSIFRTLLGNYKIMNYDQ